MENTDIWILVWDDYGLESVINLSEIDRKNIEAVLSDEKFNVNLDKVLGYLKLRARFNSHRNYELWALKISVAITIDQLQEAFDSDRVSFIEMIRSKGVKVPI